MGDSDSDISDITLSWPPATSVLGTKGSLRFRPHGTTQKPHVVLRRVEVSDYASDDEDNGKVAYFSIFALKRIECKPGKEILLSVASSDGRFGDRPIIFESSLTEDEAVDDAEEEALEELEPACLFPPRLRMRMIGNPGKRSSVVLTHVHRPSCSETQITRPRISPRRMPQYKLPLDRALFRSRFNRR